MALTPYTVPLHTCRLQHEHKHWQAPGKGGTVVLVSCQRSEIRGTGGKSGGHQRSMLHGCMPCLEELTFVPQRRRSGGLLPLARGAGGLVLVSSAPRAAVVRFLVPDKVPQHVQYSAVHVCLPPSSVDDDRVLCGRLARMCWKESCGSGSSW